MKDILDIFYNEVVEEAQKGRIKVKSEGHDLYSNVYFNSLIEGTYYPVKIEYPDTFPPTLVINDKKQFDYLLCEYVRIAFDFYKDDYDILTLDSDRDRVKYFLTTLWSNATLEDYNNPCNFLRKRIDFFDNSIPGKITHSDILNGDIITDTEVNNVYLETPYMFQVFITDGENQYLLPQISYGISNNKAYIYAIQNNKGYMFANQHTNEKDSNPYIKKINRLLYKVNDGFSNSTNYEENIDLKDITPSFLLVANIFIGVLKNMGIDSIEIPSFLVTRWNFKEIYYDIKKTKPNSNIEEINDLKIKHEQIQSNLTEKLIRTFERLCYHHSGFNISVYPSEVSTSLGLNINDEDICNNPLLDETYLGEISEKVHN